MPLSIYPKQLFQEEWNIKPRPGRQRKVWKRVVDDIFEYLELDKGEWVESCMALALVCCSIEDDQGGTPHARARVSLVSWKGRSHALLFMVPLGPPSARPMAQALWLPFE